METHPAFMDWKLHVAEMLVPLKPVHRFDEVPIKIPMMIFKKIYICLFLERG